MGSPNHSNGLNRFRKAGVIGGGAAGLVAARELKRHGFQVIVYERNHDVGGIWLYDPRVEEDDLLGFNPNRNIVSTSLYASLRTNLPRELMAFTDYPCIVKDGRDGKQFPSHREMQLYLRDFATDFKLLELIKFSTEVVSVGMVPAQQCHGSGDAASDCDYDYELDSADSERISENIHWVVRSCKSGVMEEEVFDAVVMCNGHYSQPRVPQIPGMNTWPGKQIHSHNYRVPDPFCDQVVVVIGNSSSGHDISLELATVAKEVHLSARSIGFADTTKILDRHPNLHLHSTVESLAESGTVVFHDGSSIVVDSIIYCTGYSYSFPFLDTKGKVIVDDNRVGPLYEHIFPPSLSPSLSFVGIPQKVLSFPLFELQSKWIACILSGKAKLPSKNDMMKVVKDLYKYMDAIGLPRHSTHFIDDFQYYDWLADQCGISRIEEWKKELFLAILSGIKSNIDTFRDMSYDQHLTERSLLGKFIGPIG